MGAPAVLPLPVAVLVRRARNAKSPKDRHDTAYFAWEASVRLAVAARPPGDVAPLVSASVGHWVGALRVGDVPLDAPALLEVCALFEEVALGERPKLRSVKPRRLVGTLPGYRNLVIGHGSTRTAAFYDRAAPVLLAGLDAAWAESVFLARGSRLVYAQAVEIDPSGERRARLLELSGDAGHIVDPRGTRGIPEDMLPRRLYLRDGARYEPLYPWVLFEEEELRERVLFFNGLRRRPAYLDYASGEAQRGAELAGAFPGVEAEVFALFSQEPSEDPEPEDDDPDLFGDYRILGKLGEGGMGVVYLARQESLGRLVALKMLPAHAVDSPVAVARFRREVAALSRCEHRNVVKILASGTARGTHYYAMEYVEGADLGRIYEALSSSEDFESAVSTAADAVRTERDELFEHAPEVPRSTPATARQSKARYRQLAVAFRDAARGVHHLHESGVIHRDIKPGNLMVTAADHRVVVMDLGLAAVADASRSITRDKGQILGTLRYMPPEQLQRNLLQVDHRADVYALGATFYELLCERAFFDGDSEARVIEQVLREEPLHPSKANPRLPDDLGTILRKATEKDPKLRYDSAAALAEDLDAYLEGRPITARPPTLGYLLRLAIRRNKALAATVAVAAVLVVAEVGYFTHSLAQERDRVIGQRDRAVAAEKREAERADEAERERARAETLANFMLFDLRDGLEPLGRLDLLESVALKTKEYYDALPVEGASNESLRQRATTLSNVGDVLIAQGELPAALASYRAHLAIAERLAAEQPTNAIWQHDLSIGYEKVGRVLREQGDLEAALASFETSLEIREGLAALNPAHAEFQRNLAVIHECLGGVHRAQGDVESARASHERSRAINEGLLELDPDNTIWQLDLAVTLGKLGDLSQVDGDVGAAVAAHEASLATLERLVGLDSTNKAWQRDLASCSGRLGELLALQGNYEAARACHGRVLTILERLVALDPLNADWQRQLSGAHSGLAEVHTARGDLDAAEASYDAARAITEGLAALDPTNTKWQRDLALSQLDLGRRHRERGDLGAARKAFEAALDIAKRLVALDRTNTTWRRDLLISQAGVGAICLAEGDLDAARASYEDVLALNESLVALEPKNTDWQRDLAVTHTDLGRIHAARGDVNATRSCFQKALAMQERLVALDPAHAGWQHDLSGSYFVLGLVHLVAGELDPAQASLERSVTIRERLVALDPENRSLRRDLAQSHSRLGDLFNKRGNSDADAVRHYRKAADGGHAPAMGQVGIMYFDGRGVARDLDRALDYLLKAQPSDYVAMRVWLCYGLLAKRAAGDEYVAAYRAEHSPTDWAGNLIGYMAGEVTEARLLELARSGDLATRNEQLCEAYFYVGTARLMEGSKGEAISFLEKCVATGVTNFTEYASAKAELERLR